MHELECPEAPVSPGEPAGRGGRYGFVARAVRLTLVGLGAVTLVAGLSSCGASAALSSAVLAPLSVLPDTDVVLETNLQSAAQGGLAGGGIPGISAISGNGGSGVPEVSGPPTTVSEVSVFQGTGVTVYSAFNPADKHCLGTLVLASGSMATVLGESTPGSYDFWFGPTTSAACTASGFVSEATVPKGWAQGDPSGSGWPLP
jgi:hypothetical protein